MAFTDIKLLEQQLALEREAAASARAETDRIRQSLMAARDEAEQERATLATMVENMMDGLVLAEEDGTWLLANKRVFEINGWPENLSANSLNYDDVRVRFEDGHLERRCSSLDADIERIRQRFLDADGTPRTFRRANGNCVEVRWVVLAGGRRVGMYRDITELKHQEEQARRERDDAEKANQAKSTFLATMSHEIRTPMNGVLGMLEVLEHQNSTPDQAAIVGTIRDSATALLRIIDDVLDFSKIEAGRIELEDVEFRLGALIASVVQTLLPQAVAKGLVVHADLAPGSIDQLIGDPTRLRQILYNLIGNAVKFTERGMIRVCAATSAIGDGQTILKLQVSDTGIGMDAAQQARLFQPFGQADSSTTRRFGGTGLGLSIVRRLAQLMGGDASVSSLPGQGTEFTVTMKLLTGPDLTAAEAQSAVAQELANTTEPKVLVVDVDPHSRLNLLSQLGQLGIGGKAVCDGAEALAVWQQGGYAAVLADMRMPGMSGCSLAAAIRSDEASHSIGWIARTPIIAVVADLEPGDEERCLDAGMDAYLTKPVAVSHLRCALQRWLPLDNNAIGPDAEHVAGLLPAGAETDGIGQFSAGTNM